MYNYTQFNVNLVEFVEVADTSEIEVDGRLFLDIDGQSITVFNIAGNYFAIADVCSHDDGPVGDGDLDGHEIICPRHGARFDIHNGKATGLPAVADIPAYPVRVRGSTLEVGVPKNR